MSGGAARPLTMHVTKGRAQCSVVALSYDEVRGGAIKSTNEEQPGPGVRRTAVWRLGGYTAMRMQGQANCPLLKEPRQIQANSRGDRDETERLPLVQD